MSIATEADESTYRLTLVTAPTAQPVDNALARKHAECYDDEAAVLFSEWIDDATRYCEAYLNRQLMQATWKMQFDRWPAVTRWNPYGAIRLPKPPLLSVDSITYLDANGESQTLASDQYVVDKPTKQQGMIYPAYGAIWPVVQQHPLAITVNYKAGYGTTPASVPASIRSAIYLLCAFRYRSREAVLDKSGVEPPFSVAQLLDAESWGTTF